MSSRMGKATGTGQPGRVHNLVEISQNGSGLMAEIIQSGSIQLARFVQFQ